jgi:NTP pyrophosphatase (non-canonical NTP hydrolase)
MSELNSLAHTIYLDNKAKGFHESERNKGEELMLVVTELGEAMECVRKDWYARWDDYDKDIDSGMLFPLAFKGNIKDTYEDEIADAIIRLLDICGSRGIDIEKHIIHKMNYNRTRPYKHGKKL